MARKKTTQVYNPVPGWAVYLRTSSDENQKPEMSRARQRFAIESNVLSRSDMPVYGEYVDVLTGTTPQRKDYQRMLEDARTGKFSHVIVERADRFGRNDTEALRAIDELHEFGVAVRFANQPDLDPQDPDDRVIVALSFTLARRESALLGIRVKGGLRAKRESGGFPNYAPDGYINVEGKVSGEAKKLSGRHETWIEKDPDRAPIIRLAFDLLLQDKHTLESICEELHERGYRYKSGRPFVDVTKTGQRKVNTNTLCSIFHNWAYAGWLTSKAANVPPKTLRGNWDPIVTTEEFEQGLAILEKRSQKKVRHRKHSYLLKGIAYYLFPDGRGVQRLTGSTSNAGRSGGGTSYYRLARTDVQFLCRNIDAQISAALMLVQVDPALVPEIRAMYTHDVLDKLGHIRPDTRVQLEATLKSVDDEENRTARLFAASKISEAVWDSMWREWQDRRNQIRATLATLAQQRETHIGNLDVALEIITRVGSVYNALQRSDQQELLRHMVDRVIVDQQGIISLELRAPFAYLQDLKKVVQNGQSAVNRGCEKKETGRFESAGFHRTDCSLTALSCGENESQSERFSPTKPSEYLRNIAFPQCVKFTRFSNINFQLAAR